MQRARPSVVASIRFLRNFGHHASLSTKPRKPTWPASPLDRSIATGIRKQVLYVYVRTALLVPTGDSAGGHGSDAAFRRAIARVEARASRTAAVARPSAGGHGSDAAFRRAIARVEARASRTAAVNGDSAEG